MSKVIAAYEIMKEFGIKPNDKWLDAANKEIDSAIKQMKRNMVSFGKEKVRMSKFQIGDRVRCYIAANIIKEGHVVYRDGDELQIQDTSDDGEVNIWLSHPKQCRRLIKKPRRRVWVRIDCINNGDPNSFAVSSEPGDNLVEFIEVKPKEKK